MNEIQESENETIILFMDICRFSYELIKGICKSNYENQIECFNYFNIFKKHVLLFKFHQLLKLTQVGYHLGATSCLISVLKSNEKLLMLIHNSDRDLEHYSRYLRSKTKESGSPLLRSSFKHSGYENTIIFYCLDRFEV